MILSGHLSLAGNGEKLRIRILFIVISAMLLGGQAWAEKVELKPLYQPTPSYPIALRSQGVQGLVSFKFSVKPDGSVGVVNITESPHDLMSLSVVKTVSTWQFEPMVLEDGKSELWMKSYINFSLDR